MKDKRKVIIFLIIFINMLGFGIILPLLPYYVESLGADVMMIGLLSSTYSLFQLFASPILGELSDKFGRRPILLFSIAGTAVSFFILAVAHSLPLLFLSRIIDGISGGTIATAQAYVADITSKKERTAGMGMMMAAFGLGFVIGPAFGGLLSVYGYAVPAFLAGVIATVATVLTYFYLPESLKIDRETVREQKNKRTFFRLRDFTDALTHPNIGLFLTVSFLTTVAFSLMQSTFAIFTERSLGLTARDNGLLFAYVGIIGILVQVFLLKNILKRMSENKAVIFSVAIMAFSLGGIAASSNIYMLLFALTFLGIANSLSGPVLSGVISKNTPETEQGNVAGMTQSVGSMARLIGPVSGTFLFEKFGIKSPYMLSTGILLLTAAYAANTLRLLHGNKNRANANKDNADN